MELIRKDEMKVLSNPGVESWQLLNPENSDSRRITITRVIVQVGHEQPRHSHDACEQVWICLKGEGTLLLADDCEKPFKAGDVARFAEGDIHGIRNDSQNEIEYISVTSPPIDFAYAYKDKR